MERRLSLEQRAERLVQRRWDSSAASSALRDAQERPAGPGDPNLLARSLSVVPESGCHPDPQMPPQTPKCFPVPSPAPCDPQECPGYPQLPHPIPGDAPDSPFFPQVLLRPCPRGPESAKPVLGSAPSSPILDDPLVQWRLRRCRGEEPALDTPSAGRALLGSAAPQGALQGVPRGRSHDPSGALPEAVPWASRDPPEGQWPIRRHFFKPLHQGASSPQPGSQEPLWLEPCWRSHDSGKALWPMRSGALHTLQGAVYSQSRDSHEALWPIGSSCCASLRQGAPPCGKRDCHGPLRQGPCRGSHGCLGAPRRAPHGHSRGSQDGLQPAREALPEPLRRGGPGLGTREPREAPQPTGSSAGDALQGAPLQQPLGPLGDPLLWMLRCHRRAIRGRLRAIETLLEPPPGRPQPVVGQIKQ